MQTGESLTEKPSALLITLTPTKIVILLQSNGYNKRFSRKAELF